MSEPMDTLSREHAEKYAIVACMMAGVRSEPSAEIKEAMVRLAVAAYAAAYRLGFEAANKQVEAYPQSAQNAYSQGYRDATVDNNGGDDECECDIDCCGVEVSGEPTTVSMEQYEGALADNRDLKNEIDQLKSSVSYLNARLERQARDFDEDRRITSARADGMQRAMETFARGLSGH